MLYLKLIRAVSIGGVAFAVPAISGETTPSLAGISTDCQKALQAMAVCRDKTMAAGAPASVRQQWDKQLADTVKMWRAFHGRAVIENSCKAIAANPDCNSE